LQKCARGEALQFDENNRLIVPATTKPRPVAHLLLGAVDVDGRLSPSSVERVLRTRWAQLAYCYDREFKPGNIFDVTIDIFWAIDEAGAVRPPLSDRTSSRSWQTERIARCLSSTIAGLEFDRATASSVVRASFSFSTSTD
jgi:hypothetical protein